MPAGFLAKPNLVIELMRTLQPGEEKKRIQGHRARRPLNRDWTPALTPSSSPFITMRRFPL